MDKEVRPQPLHGRSHSLSKFRAPIFVVGLVLLLSYQSVWNYRLSVKGCNQPTSRSQEKGRIPATASTAASFLSTAASPVFPACSDDEKKTVLHNFPAKAITRETNCPHQTWFDDYLYNTFFPVEYDGKRTLVSIFLGCNKGDDAVLTLKKLSGNDEINVDVYRNKFEINALQGHTNRTVMGRQCGADKSQGHILLQPGFHPFVRRFRKSVDNIVVHCVEAMPITANTLQKTADDFREWNQHFVVTNAAVDKDDGTLFFPNFREKVGAEHLGIVDCKVGLRPWMDAKCQQVKAYSVDTYLREKVIAPNPQLVAAVQSDEAHYNSMDWDSRARTQRDDSSQSIPTHLDYRPNFVVDFLSVDVEGLDWQVLGQGGADWTLHHTRYLEFEYHGTHPWDTQLLSEAIDVLKRKFGFICYWAGKDKLIRLTDCFQEYMEVHQWSNVACAPENSLLAAQMEAKYTRLISE